jgi:hypothetical protein
MHCRTFLIALIAAAAFRVLGASAAADPLAALRQASGCVAWHRLTGLDLTGRHHADGLTGHFSETLDTRRGRFAVASTEGPFASGNGFDGTTAWSRDFSGGAHPLDAASAVERSRTNAWLAARRWCRTDNAGARLKREPPRTDGASTFDVVAVRPPGGSPVRMWIDRRSHLLDRVEQRLNESTLIERYDDWRTVAGTVIPFVVRDEFPEDATVELFELHDVRLHAEPRGASFAQPVRPNDVAMLHGATVTRIPYVLEGQKPIVEVSLNGVGPFPFVLDTGGHFILTPATASRIGIVGRGGAHSTGSGTRILQTQFVRVRTMRIGDAVVTNDVADVIPYRFGRLERGPRPPKAGWLGLSLFERFAVTIDPVSRTIALRPLTRPRPPPVGTRILITFDEDAPLVECSVDGRPGPCMIDTGNAGPTIVEGYWARRHGLASRLAHGVTIGDGIDVSRADVAFGPVRAQRELAEYQPPTARGSESTTVEAAILSEGLIDRFTTTIDYARHGIWMRPVSHPYVRPFNRSGLQADKQRDGSFVVWRVIPDSPAARAGFRTDMKVLAVDGIPAQALAATDFSDLGVGAVGTIRTFRIADGRTTRTITLRLRELLP